MEDPAKPLAPKRPATEAEQDKVHSAALLATGRVLEQQGDIAAALQKYQRAYRYATDGSSILREIVPLAFSLGRNDEAVRYALIAAEEDPSDAVLLRRLALYLAEQSDWERAFKFYELLLAHADSQEKNDDVVQIHIEAGRVCFLLEKYHRAAEVFAVVDQALRNPKDYGLSDQQRDLIVGDDGLIWQLLAECYLQADKLDAAQRAYQQAHRIQPDKALHGYHTARIAARRGRPVEALDHLNAYFTAGREEEGSAPYELLVELLGDLNQQDEATTRLEQLHGDDSENRALGYYLALRYLDADELAAAEKIYRSIAKDKGDDPPLIAYRGLLEVYTRQGDVEALLSVLGTAVETAGALELFETEVAAILADENLVARLIEQASERQESGKLAGNQALAIAELALEAEDFAQAGKLYDLAVEKLPDRQAGIFLSWGLGLLLADKADKSAEVFRRGVDAQLPDAEQTFYYYLAGALAMADKTESALKAAQAAADQEPDSAEFAARVAWVQYHAERYDAAQQSYQALLDRFGADYESSANRNVLREARLVLSNIAVEKNDLPLAEQWLEQVLDEFPEDVGAMNDLGYLWADQGKHLGRALRMIQKAVEAEPENPAYRDSLGWVYFRLGKINKAVEALEKAAAGEQPHGEILDHLGDAYAKAGQAEKAEAAWQRAAVAYDQAGDAEDARRVRKKLKP